MEKEAAGIRFQTGDNEPRMENLMHHVNEQTLMEEHRKQSRRKATGIDGVTKDEYDANVDANLRDLVERMKRFSYRPMPVRRTYIPKANGKQRPLGIPTVADRVVQQAVAQVLSRGYERYFSENSCGFRPGRDCHLAVGKALDYLNAGYEWVVDLDIEKYFDTVNHDKLVSILRERINDATTLHLIRSFLKAGVMEDGLVSPSVEGVPQGGPLSPVLSNVYLDKLDKELESRGLYYVRYADDCNIFVKSEMAANRVMASITSWLERKLRLKVSATKTKVTRPSKSVFLGFTFWKGKDGWKAMPAKDRKAKLYDKTREILCRKRAAARPMAITFTELNQLIRGWINYFGIGSMKGFMQDYSAWMRHKVRVVILKQWKKPKTIYKNLQKLNRIGKCRLSDEEVYKAANSRLGLYRKCAGNVVNYTLSPKILGMKTKDRPGLVDPLAYYLARST